MAQNAKLATVGNSRSSDKHVHLKREGGPEGWAWLGDNPFAHGIAAAAEASGKPVYMTYAHHDPAALNNSGFFTGVQLGLVPFTS